MAEQNATYTMKVNPDYKSKHDNKGQYKDNEEVEQVYNKATQEANVKQVIKVKATELIPDRLYLGTQWLAHDTQSMKELGIKYLISCMKDEWGFVNNLKELEENMIVIEEMDDENKENDNIEEIANTYIQSLVAVMKENTSDKVLIYCKSSANLSPCIAVLTIMLLENKTLKEAHEFVKEKHGKIMCISDDWMKSLREYDKKLYGEYSTDEKQLETKQTKIADIMAKIQAAKAQLAKEQGGDDQKADDK